MSSECPVCMLDWCSQSCIPKMLMCGHSYCENCLKLLFQEVEGSGIVQCPTCMQEHKFASKEEMEQKVATNFSLIPKPLQRLASSKDIDGQIDNFDHENFADENFNIEIEPNAKCSKHNSPIHSYVKSNKVLLCSFCIEEGAYDKSRIKSITQVVKETRGSMYSYKLKLNQNLLQLKKFREVLERIKNENQRKVQDNIKKHFRNLEQILKNAEKLAQQKFDTHKKKQEKKIKEVVDGLKDIETILCANKTKLHEYIHSKNDDLVFELDNIEGIINTKIEIIPKIQIPDFKIKFSTDDSDLVKIDHFLNTMHLYSVINNDPTDVKNLLKDSFQIENYWICHTCSSQNKTILNRKTDKSLSRELAKNKASELICLACKSFKPLELYPSFYHNKGEISEDEMRILNKRRKAEKKDCTRLDSNYNKNNEEWFIINAEWLKDWKMFVNNKRSSTAFGARRCIHKEVGILDPGPVTNHLLLDEDNNPLPNLVKGKHYRGVNKAVWKQFYETYGGGPVIRKRELSIYSENFKEKENDKPEAEINKSGSKKMLKRYSEDAETVVRNSNDHKKIDNRNNFMILNKKRTHLSKKRVVDASAESNLRRCFTGKLDSGAKVGSKGSSIPRRNLFKKKEKPAPDSSIQMPNNHFKKQIYTPLYEKRLNSSRDTSAYMSGKSIKNESFKKLEDSKSHRDQQLRLARRKSGDVAKIIAKKDYDSDDHDQSSEDGGFLPVEECNIFSRSKTGIPSTGFSKLKNLFGRKS
ncbi:unnamed protein product [Moneuplotes crassus]|uniref:Uncharacterized protein n=1 Tax=Euplotes crassus TaxID=5936 RepID=A0AAD1Y9L1_EUPCR|nr:unnamed protein product [Moneuplotes crassus]